ncbi:hypothetical protein CR513_31615, partial [Mucuna pruriens]
MCESPSTFLSHDQITADKIIKEQKKISFDLDSPLPLVVHYPDSQSGSKGTKNKWHHLGPQGKTNYLKEPWLNMTEKPQIGGRILPTRWENQKRRSEGTMRSSKKISDALSVVKWPSPTEQTILTVIKALGSNNTGYRSRIQQN